VGNAPFDMEFDGANVWVSIAGSNVVAKL